MKNEVFQGKEKLLGMDFEFADFRECQMFSLQVTVRISALLKGKELIENCYFHLLESA